jgi:hypothetical protein
MMAKVFEDYFSEIQADMVSICLEYVNGIADTVYIYGASEAGMITPDYFYCINGTIVQRHKLNDIGSFQYDVSPDRQRQVSRILIEDIEKLMELCDENKRDMPTQMKMVFDVKTRKFSAEYSYELMYLKYPEKSYATIAQEWYEEVKNASESCV